ncbi:MAG: AMP-binding protein [Rhodospirillaceae bacterium]|nr:AMP-binding protein [Rhodospirillaceae bacterium]
MQMPQSRTAMALINEMAARHPGREALIDGEQRYSWSEFQGRVRDLAKGLHAAGIRRGDKVAILMGNRAEWLIADFAIMALGGVMVAANTWATARELAYQLNHSECRLLIMSATYLKRDYTALIEEARAENYDLSGLQQIYCIADGAPPAGMTPFEDLWRLGADVPDSEIDAAEAAVEGEDTACLLYTSGSTALPKGVPLQHYALVENMWGIGERLHIQADDRLWLGVSLFWGLACENALFAVWSHGATIILQESFDAGEALRLIEAERCTVYYGTPNMTLAIEEHPDRAARDISSLRVGATLGSPQQIQCLIDLGVREACQIYGLTESYGNCSINDAHDTVARRTESIGKALPGNDMIIADMATGKRMPTGEIGEIRLKGYVTKGYYKEPDKTAEAFDADGYFRTGDLGFVDDDGYFYFRGRAKEMIKTGGINVSPAEIEELLISHDAVELAYVIGLKDARRDEIVAAVIVATEPIDSDELIALCRASLAVYKVPRKVKFVTHADLPLTSTGKLQKNRLKNLFE